LLRRFPFEPSWIGRLSTPGRYAVAVAIVALSSGAAVLLDRLTGSDRVAGAYLVGALLYLVLGARSRAESRADSLS